MLDIRPDQMQMFADRAKRTFQDRVLTYLKTQHGERLQDLDDKQATERIRQLSAAAEKYGINTEAPVVQFIELALVYGDDFHDCGQYPQAESILNGAADGPAKMAALCELASRELS